MAEEKRQCAADLTHFLEQYGKVQDANLLRAVPFTLWPHLRVLHEARKTHQKIIILKARQVGVSWDEAGDALHTAKFSNYSNTLILSKSQEDSNLVLNRARFLDGQLPEWLRSRYGKSNDSLLEFPRRDSRIVALPATEDAGRSDTATKVKLDEYAAFKAAEINYSAIMPTVGAGGQVEIISTAKGFGNQFYRIWQKAQEPGFDVDANGVWIGKAEGRNGYLALFFPWFLRPGRDQDWYDRQAEDLEPDILHQEYPNTPEEAFRATGRPVFTVSGDVDPALKPLSREQIDDNPALRPLLGLVDRRLLTLYRPPRQKGRHLGGADVAEGLASRDASCCVVLDPTDFAVVAYYWGHPDLDEFADHLDLIGTAYPGLLAVERNNHGHAVLVRLRQILGSGPTAYTLYHEVDTAHLPAGVLQIGREKPRLGWLTTRKTKPLMITDLAEALRKQWLRIGEPRLLAEIRRYETKDDGSTGAPDSYHDDGVMALALAFQMLKWLRTHAPQGVQTVTVRGLRAS